MQREKEHRYQRGKKCRRESRKGGITGKATQKRKSRMCKWMMEMCQKREKEEEHEAGKQKEGAIRLSEK